MDIVIGWFLDALGAVVSVFASVLSLINPCPFPGIISSVSFDGSVLSRAAGWINAFIDVSFIISVAEAWFLLFGTAWGIMLILKWLKAR